MATFNFTKAAVDSYKFVWKERQMLVHFSFWPLMLKIATFSIIGLLGYEKNLLRQGLIMLPANFLEGWLVAVAIRYAIFGEARPVPLNGKEGAQTPSAIATRRAILAGIIIYMLINMVGMLAGGLAVSVSEIPEPEKVADPTLATYFIMLMAVAFSIYMFRYFWMHVPVVMEVPLSVFLRKIQGFNTSFYMMALWMMCMLPVLVFVSFFGQIVLSATGDSIVYGQIIALLRAFMEMLVAIVTGIAMAYAVREMLSVPAKK